MTWPGTMIGKPGGYGITNFADTSSGPSFSRRSISSPSSLTYSQRGRVVREVVRGAHVALVRRSLGVLAERVVEPAEVRQVRHVLHERLDAGGVPLLAPVRRPVRAAGRSTSRCPRSALSRCARSLRVLLMLICTSTLLREVLLIWMSYDSASRALNCEPSKSGVSAQQRDARRVEKELVAVERRDRLRERPARHARKSLKPEARYCSGIISAGVAVRKYFEISGCRLISVRELDRELQRAHA